jgi:hypothetical protein
MLPHLTHLVYFNFTPQSRAKTSAKFPNEDGLIFNSKLFLHRIS